MDRTKGPWPAADSRSGPLWACFAPKRTVHPVGSQYSPFSGGRQWRRHLLPAFAHPQACEELESAHTGSRARELPPSPGVRAKRESPVRMKRESPLIAACRPQGCPAFLVTGRPTRLYPRFCRGLPPAGGRLARRANLHEKSLAGQWARISRLKDAKPRFFPPYIQSPPTAGDPPAGGAAEV